MTGPLWGPRGGVYPICVYMPTYVCVYRCNYAYVHKTMCIYIYTYAYVNVYMMYIDRYMCIYTSLERERDTKRERESQIDG